MTIEEQVANAMSEQGWTVLRNGWPDLLCHRKGADGQSEILAVEVKDANTNDCLRPSQIKNHIILNAAGIKVVIVRGVNDCTGDLSGKKHDSIDQYTQDSLAKIRERLPKVEQMAANFTKSIEKRRKAMLEGLDKIEQTYKRRAEILGKQLKEIEDTLAVLSAGQYSEAERVSRDIG